ncbi:hypothetical protein IQ277_34355 [Nostocales cyanobacterium LEGE 12452]|nr:hypothetical protein [Nostocales cyanobacterium LEGE 12452]
MNTLNWFVLAFELTEEVCVLIIGVGNTSFSFKLIVCRQAGNLLPVTCPRIYKNLILAKFNLAIDF